MGAQPFVPILGEESRGDRMKNVFHHKAVTVFISIMGLSLFIGLFTLTSVYAEQSRQQRNPLGGWDTNEGSIIPLPDGRIRLPGGGICRPDGEGGWYCPSGHYTPRQGGGSSATNKRSGFTATPNDQGGYDTPKGPVTRDGAGGYIKPAGVYILPPSATGKVDAED
jgi:hypothetical protein